ncbi:MAG TPA: hypothetical protein VL335_02630 [Candidatus Paceibacterota bacterium]|jgi:hypothetical protein|nr:hypothetical protein [Candidatus Paceibacterota bacterium]
MVNPFDKSFFRFFFGFVLILALSFFVLYAVGQWGGSLDTEAAALLR